MSDKDNNNKTEGTSYIGVGIAIGLAFGVAIKNIGVGLALGLAIGAGINSVKSKKGGN